VEIHHLLNDPLGEGSLIQFSDNIDDKTLDQIPLFLIAEAFLKIIQREKLIKLTPLGALPKKVMVEIYNKRILLDEFIESGLIKLWKEENCISIRSARLAAELGGLVRKANGKLTLTKKTLLLLETNDRLKLFKLFFPAFTEKFLWGYNDGYTKFPVGQLGWAFSVILLDKFGEQPRTVNFYADKFLTAFPNLITFFEDKFTTAQRQFTRCYGLRTFDRFFVWFGFVTPDKNNNYMDFDTNIFKQAEVVKKIFKINT